jgi:glycosyltransferase involved in cell wall biosynthesis
MTTSIPLVSIVTPVYNGAEYLQECIEGVLAQSYQHWEYTIVDNCSCDGTADIARRYAAMDARIHVCVNDHFLPAIANHNAALRRIAPMAKYVKVAFGDDRILPNCLERMIRVAEEHPSVSIVGAHVLEGDHVRCTGLPRDTACFDGRWICRAHLLNGLHVFGSANSLLYRAQLVRARDPFYNEANIHADTEVCFPLLRQGNFGFVHDVLTFTRVRSASLTALSHELQTGHAGNLRILVAHGRDFLTDAELNDCLELALSRYYKFLSQSLLQSRQHLAEIWNYHVKQLDELGLRFSRTRFARAMISNAVAAASSPRRTAQKLLNAALSQFAPPLPRVRSQ